MYRLRPCIGVQGMMREIIFDPSKHGILNSLKTIPMSIERGGGPSENEREFDQEVWERLKAEKKPVFVIDEARKTGVPEDVIQQFGREVAAIKEREDGPDAAFHFMHYMKIGEPVERTALAQKAYKGYMDEADYGYAAAIAQDAFGKESDEWKAASAASDAAWKKDAKREARDDEEVEDEPVVISKHATLADLFKTIAAIEEKTELGATHFEEELHDSFDTEIVQRLLALRGTSEASTLGVVDFFKAYDYDASDIQTFLPIKFSRAKSKKKK
jgi:hypothetical protein